MKIFLIVLIALISTYLYGVLEENDWNLFAGLGPSELIERLLIFIYGFVTCTLVLWVILGGLIDVIFN